MVEVVHFPLRSYGRPSTKGQSIGRFRVYVNGFLDPVVYEQGKAVTFVGEARGVENGSVGELEYVFPVMDATGYYLWKDIQQVDVSMIYMGPHWGYGYGYGFPYHTRHRVYIRSENSSNVGSGGGSAPPPSSSTKPIKPTPRDRQTGGLKKRALGAARFCLWRQ